MYPYAAEQDAWTVILDKDGDEAPFHAPWPPAVTLTAYYELAGALDEAPGPPPSAPCAAPPPMEDRQRAQIGNAAARAFADLLKLHRSACVTFKQTNNAIARSAKQAARKRPGPPSGSPLSLPAPLPAQPPAQTNVIQLKAANRPRAPPGHVGSDTASAAFPSRAPAEPALPRSALPAESAPLLRVGVVSERNRAPPAVADQTTQEIFDLFADAGQETIAIPPDDDDPEETAADIADRLATLAAPPPNPETLTGFQTGHGTCLPVTLMTGKDLLRLLELPPATNGPVAEAGVQKATRDEHRRLLRLLLTMPPAYQAMQVSTGVSEFLDSERRKRGWKRSTTFKYMCSTQGACSALPLYRRGVAPISLGQCPIWKAAMRTCARQMKTELPRHPTPATMRLIAEAIEMETSLPVRVILLLCWHAAGRVSDILRLLRADVQVTASGQLQLTHRHHKTVAHKGPYHITTAPLTPGHAAMVRRWLLQREESKFLFPATPLLATQTRTALRRAAPHLELRSLRRGSLMDMASRKVPETTMLEFSGHTTVAMLRRYLAWGAAVVAITDLTAAAGPRLA